MSDNTKTRFVRNVNTSHPCGLLVVQTTDQEVKLPDITSDVLIAVFAAVVVLALVALGAMEAEGVHVLSAVAGWL